LLAAFEKKKKRPDPRESRREKKARPRGKKTERKRTTR